MLALTGGREPLQNRRKSKMTRNQTNLRKAILVSYSLLVSVLVCEGILRLIDYHYTPLRIAVQYDTDWRAYHIFEQKDFVYDSDLLWRPKPGLDGVFNF